jgi:hypothetical protein
MSPRIFGIVNALLLTIIAAVHFPGTDIQAAHAVTPSQSRLATLTHSYFVVLNRGLATGNVSGLSSIIAPTATLTERSAMVHGAPSTQTNTIRDRSAIVRFYRHLAADFPGGHWVVGIQNQVSPTTMVVYARAAGAQGRPSLYSVQRVTVRSGKIIRLNLMLDYLL